MKKVQKKVVKKPTLEEGRVLYKKPVVAKPEPKALPIVDGYQVVKVLEEGHTQTHLLCDAVSEGNRVRIHVNRKLF